jgi:DNA-binding Lrp family transcriptional regulator
MSNWTIFSNHGHVLFCLTRDPEARLRDVAADVGITERAVQKIVRDLQDGGMISITKSGRRNRYRIHKKQTLRHEIEASCKIRDLIKVVNKDPKIEPFDAALVDDIKEPRKEPKPLDSVVETSLLPAELPGPGPSEPVRQKEEMTGQEETVQSDGIETQQGSLF